MREKTLKIGDVVFSSIGMGVITNCYEGIFGDNEVMYSVNYFEYGNKFSRKKDFIKFI